MEKEQWSLILSTKRNESSDGFEKFLLLRSESSDDSKKENERDTVCILMT